MPGLDGIALYGAHAGSGLARLGGTAPYWAYAWAGGVALARHIAAHPETVRGRTVLDLGAGSGLVGIVAARCGASMVLAADIDPYARAAIALNAAANGVSVRCIAEDMLDSLPPPVEIVLAGDVYYDAAVAARVTRFLARCRSAGCAVLVGDPGRAHLPADLLAPIAGYRVDDFGGRVDGGGDRAIVYTFAP